MPMRIVIDARRIRDFGAGTYIRNLVRSLGALDDINFYTLVTGRGDYPELSGLPPNFQTAPYRPPAGSLRGRLAFPLFLRKIPADLYHVPINSVPLGMPRPYVVTIHDMGSLLFGKTHGLHNNFRLFRFRRGLHCAARIIAVSNATRRDVETVIGIPSGRIRTIYNAPDPIFLKHASIGAGERTSSGHNAGIQRILDRYRIDYPFLLYAGRTNPQKNITRLVEAFAVILGEMKANSLYKDLRLIIIGDEISKYPALRHAVIQSRVEHAVRFLGFVPIETLRVFYQTAAAFVFPSLYEGFGLPPLEAMACGTPVVTSRVSALREVVGDAAVIVNPENVFDIARGIREILDNCELRASVVRKGFEQVQRFSWHNTAAEVLDTYSEVLSSRK